MITVESLAFADEASPRDEFEDGLKVLPSLTTWRNVPSGEDSIVLIIEDADGPTPAPFIHDSALDLPGGSRSGRGGDESPGTSGSGGRIGKNSFRKAEYHPADPTSGCGDDLSVLQIFALSKPPALPEESAQGAVMEAMHSAVFAKGVLIGTYERA